ncbi:BgtTE-56004 [Blumeria graminis f. sp. tritici]|uniref:BgtTE-56004 n=1 Tax=Blumeria graminis f. sp. tritici TaxID=62690 RepID=A0A9X9L8M1_BLUGR|nr:BgtTE-56004 [Blumeria graminis f. sp. tritici]
MCLRPSISQSILHLRFTFIHITLLTYTRSNEETRDGDGACTKEEEKGKYTEGVSQIPNDDNNPMVRYGGARQGQRRDMGRQT